MTAEAGIQVAGLCLAKEAAFRVFGRLAALKLRPRPTPGGPVGRKLILGREPGREAWWGLSHLCLPDIVSEWAKCGGGEAAKFKIKKKPGNSAGLKKFVMVGAFKEDRDRLCCVG